MLNLKGAGLPNVIKLSNYLRNDYEAVRLSDLRADQTLEMDVSLDGKHQHPDLPIVAEWIGAEGREGVHTALLSIRNSPGFTLNFTDKSELKNSRGRGLGISKSDGFTINDAYVRSARTAGIALEDCKGFTFNRGITLGTGNYQDKKGEGPNWPGSIKMQRCSGYTMNDCYSILHVGNGMTPTGCQRGIWNNPTCIDIDGASIYLNAAPGHIVNGGLCFGNAKEQPPAYVLNSEKEVEGVSEGARLEDCHCFDAAVGFGIWGNQGKEGLVLEHVAVLNSLMIANEGWKVHENATVQQLDQAGTLYLDPKALPAGVLAELRILGTALADVVRRHEEWPIIAGRRAALVAAIAKLRKSAPVPVDVPALRALVGEGEALAFAQGEWVKRVRAVVGA